LSNNIFLKKLDYKGASEFLLKKDKRIFDKNLNKVVRKILDDVREGGDKKLISLSKKLDKTNFSSIKQATFFKKDFLKSYKNLNPKIKKDLNFLKKRIKSFHQKIKVDDLKLNDEVFESFGQVYRPIENIGIYAPGGKAIYPSSVLMTSLVAKIAGCKKVQLFFPSSSDLSTQLMLATAYIAGVDVAYNFGGAQAIAAMAFGTETIASSDKIFGPGNKYVAEAKRQVYGEVGIDSFTGPSEVLIISDNSSDLDMLASDLLAQAEHGEDSKCIFISIGKNLYDPLSKKITDQLKNSPRKKIIQEALKKFGLFIEVNSLKKAVEISNLIAPEHLQISVKNEASLNVNKLIAGAIFIGKQNSAVLGDYCAGPSHVIPTSGAARFSSPVSLEDFLVRSSFVKIGKKINKNTFKKILSHSMSLASIEGLDEHADALNKRIKKLSLN
tara:strand:- start:6514 stop:7836 length:1323 start_codon:yes stop_codon:yes gene_type:complete